MVGVWVWLMAVASAGVVVAVPGSDVVHRAGVSGLELEIASDGQSAVEAAFASLAAREFEDAARGFRALAEAGGGADLYFMEAVAHYEAGNVRRSEAAAAAGLDLEPLHGALLGLLGLVIADLGRGDEAAGLLLRAESVASRALAEQGSAPLRAAPPALAHLRYHHQDLDERPLASSVCAS